MGEQSWDDLGAAATVRMCHDLAGPAGALANGLELLEIDDGDGLATEVRGLLRTSAQTLGARLDFFRAVFGLPNGRALKAATGAQVARAYLACLGDAQRVYELSEFPEELAEGPEYWRLALTLVLIGADALPFGGRIGVVVKDGLPQLHAAGRRAGFSEAALAALEGRVADAHVVAGAVLAKRAADLGLAARWWSATESCGVGMSRL
jgi:histidine phosphotransferase ChpT